MLVRYRGIAGSATVEETAQMLHYRGGLGRSYKHAMRTLVIMIERGQFYETLGTDLGGGACLALGTSLPETQYVSYTMSCTEAANR